jgi:hypothetical protein
MFELLEYFKGEIGVLAVFSLLRTFCPANCNAEGLHDGTRASIFAPNPKATQTKTHGPKAINKPLVLIFWKSSEK